MTSFTPPPYRDLLQLMRAAFWPPSPRKVRLFIRMLGGVSAYELKLVRDIIMVRMGRKSAHDLLEEMARLNREIQAQLDDPKMHASEYVQKSGRALAQNFARALDQLEEWHQNVFIPLDYVTEMAKWTHDILSAQSPTEVYHVLDRRIRGTLSGKLAPGFVPIQLDAPDPQLLTALQQGDATRALLLIENAPLSQLQAQLPVAPATALVHTIVSDQGVYAIITPRVGLPEIILCPAITRETVINLLRGWLWLYYFHSKQVFSQMLDMLFAMPGIPTDQKEMFKKGGWRYPYLKIFYSQAVAEWLMPTEIPMGEQQLLVPFASWLLLEAILRELGKGDFLSGDGLWKQIDEKLNPRGVKRIIVSPEKALMLFPHHGAILNIDRDGQKECVLDRYEIVYLPQGTLTHIAPAKPQSPRLLMFGTDGEALSSVGMAALRALAPGRITEWHSIDDNRDCEKFVAQAATVNALTFLGHGKYNWGDPSQSFLGLLMDRNSTGLDDSITMEKLVKKIPKQLHLVTLAGCETGLPTITKQGSDYQGFAEILLLHSGVSAVVLTLWPVPQIPTVLLMRQFHTYWLLGDESPGEKRLPPATALRKAQLWLRALTHEQVIVELEALTSVHPSEEIAKEIEALHESIVEQPYAHPYFWATFYVMGNVL